MSFWRRPQSTLGRRIVFQLHVWTGLAVGLYALVIGLTGSLLVFRQELQTRAYPGFFAQAPAGAELANPVLVLDSLRQTFPGYRFSGIDYPHARRGTFLAYLSRGNELKTVFADPVSGRVLGELPHDGWIQLLQELHFTLLIGPTGYVVNGIAASCLLTMCLTGLVVWWPGVGRVRQSLAVHAGRSWKRIVWELHGAAGIWTVVLLLVWSISGIYFSFPVPFRNAVGSVTTLTESLAPQSGTPAPTAPEPSTLIARALADVPHAQIARFVVPSGPAGTYAVVLARNAHGDWDSSDEVTVYFDRYTGERLKVVESATRTRGDAFLTWLGLLHVGSFGGAGVRALWFAAGLSFPTLCLTGMMMWWNRFVRPARSIGVKAAI